MLRILVVVDVAAFVGGMPTSVGTIQIIHNIYNRYNRIYVI